MFKIVRFIVDIWKRKLTGEYRPRDRRAEREKQAQRIRALLLRKP